MNAESPVTRREALKAVVATSLVVTIAPIAAAGSGVEPPPAEAYVIENDYPYFGFEPVVQPARDRPGQRGR